MNQYEFLLLLAHMGAPPEHIQYAGEHTSNAEKARRILHEHHAAQWIDAIPFEGAPGTPAPWVAYAYQLMSMPAEWIVRGLPQGEARSKAANVLRDMLRKS